MSADNVLLILTTVEDGVEVFRAADVGYSWLSGGITWNEIWEEFLGLRTWPSLKELLDYWDDAIDKGYYFEYAALFLYYPKSFDEMKGDKGCVEW